ncbi:MAG TPA: class I SAM-dependent methyltransferase [Candidatus Baltobacteraceae bacterium]|nr:class I SAM-dependent methyltransferase [Candidatus Baltobacteraceae bacterium]
MKARLDLRRVLDIPVAYDFFQRITRTREYRRKFMEFVPVPNGGSVLEIGCGPGTNYEYLPQGREIRYVGCDSDSGYIAHARSRYRNGAQFFDTPVGGLRSLGVGPFDVALAWGLLHHISDAQVRTLAEELDELIVPAGKFCTFDPCFTSDQSLLARVLTACDRGRYVRYPEHYAALLAERFPRIELQTWPPGTVLPFSVAVIVAAK